MRIRLTESRSAKVGSCESAVTPVEGETLSAGAVSESTADPRDVGRATRGVFTVQERSVTFFIKLFFVGCSL